MKYFGHIFLVIASGFLFFTSCTKKIGVGISDAHPCFILNEDLVNDTVQFFPWSPNWKQKEGNLSYTMPFDGSIVPFEPEQSFVERKKIKTEIIIDSNIGTSLDSSTEEFVDIILKKLYLGIELVEVTKNSADLKDINTTEIRNSENILKSLISTSFDEEKDLHIYLFKHSEFFNTSNAFAFKSGKHRIILGNKDLFNSSLLFVHELGHSFGLGHNNVQDTCEVSAKEDSFYFFNIMHESNIGCAICLDPQQALIVGREDSYISFDKKTSNLLPIGAPTDCDCNTKYYKTKMDKYINSKDRSIDNAALVGMYDELTPELLKEAETGEIAPSIAETFRANFEKSSKALFDDDSIRNIFIEQSMTGLAKLRQTNIIRLMGHNIIKSTNQKEEDFNWEELFTNSEVLTTYIDSYPTEVKTNPLMSKSICDTALAAKEETIKRLESEIDELRKEVDNLLMYKDLYGKCQKEVDSLYEYKELYTACQTEIRSISIFKERYYVCKSELEPLKNIEELYNTCLNDSQSLKRKILAKIGELSNTDNLKERNELINNIKGILLGEISY